MGVVESTIARHIVRVRYEDLPRQVVEATKEKVLDTIGVMIAGSGAPGSDIVASQLAEWGGKGESNVVVTGRRLPAPHAAQIHGGWAHADEFCDSDDRQTCKPSATAVPVALALAEARGATGKDLILAIALGVDLACRIGMALRPQPASIGRDEGVFSGAAAGAKVLGLDEEGVLNALGIGYTQLAPAGMSTQSPSLTKRLIPGQVNRAAAWAAVLAGQGFVSGREMLQGSRGYYRTFRREEGDQDELTQDLGTRFEVAHCPKPYPSGRFTHQPIDAALALRKEHRLDPEEIERITVGMSRRCIMAVGGGLDGAGLASKQAPRGVVDAQTSIPYNVAVALRKGSVTLGDFSDEAIRDPGVLALSSRSVEQHRPELDDFPDFITPAIVDVTLKGGTTLSKKVTYAKGHVSNPCTPEEMKEKFWACVGHAVLPLSQPRIEQAVRQLDDLESVKDVGGILGLLAH